MQAEGQPSLTLPAVSLPHLCPAPEPLARPLTPGTTNSDLDNSRSRSQQSATGALVCDALIHFVNNQTDFDETYGAPLDFCMTNGGGLRASIPAVGMRWGPPVCEASAAARI